MDLVPIFEHFSLKNMSYFDKFGNSVFKIKISSIYLSLKIVDSDKHAK